METILYVENDLSLIDGLEYTLETNGYSVGNVRTVEQALALFNSKSYHLLLLDVILPDGSGFEICKWCGKALLFQLYFNSFRSGNQYCEGPGYGRRQLYHKTV